MARAAANKGVRLCPASLFRVPAVWETPRGASRSPRLFPHGSRRVLFRHWPHGGALAPPGKAGGGAPFSDQLTCGPPSAVQPNVQASYVAVTQKPLQLSPQDLRVPNKKPAQRATQTPGQGMAWKPEWDAVGPRDEEVGVSRAAPLAGGLYSPQLSTTCTSRQHGGAGTELGPTAASLIYKRKIIWSPFCLQGDRGSEGKSQASLGRGGGYGKLCPGLLILQHAHPRIISSHKYLLSTYCVPALGWGPQTQLLNLANLPRIACLISRRQEAVQRRRPSSGRGRQH